MNRPIILLILLSLQSMASTPIEASTRSTDVSKNHHSIRIQRKLPLGRELQEVRTIRDVRPLREIEEIFSTNNITIKNKYQKKEILRTSRATRKVRESRSARTINFVYASPKVLKPIQIAGLK